MKKVIIFICCFLAFISSICFARVYVKGYYRKDGTYVAPHYRSDPDGIITNNYSYPGNYNPNTGEITGGSLNTSPTYTTDYSPNIIPQSSIDYSSNNTTRPPLPHTPPSKVTVSVPSYSVKINNQDIYNYSVGYDPFTYNDITYIPMTSYLVNALNLSLTFDSTNGFNLSKKETITSKKEQFLDDYIVIIGVNDTLNYHKYGCPNLDLTEFYAYNTEFAKACGYTACTLCNK